MSRVGGKNPINLTKDSAADDTQPAFSPDGDRIVFRSEREGEGIFLMGATGQSVKRLTNFGYDPAWSPDGKEIACADDGPLDPNYRNNPSLTLTRCQACDSAILLLLIFQPHLGDQLPDLLHKLLHLP